jgi:glycosyltransferase involved in cell wall biosynthesis
MSKILIHSIAFSPDGVSTAYLYNDIASKFKEFGYDVSVITTTPHYNVIQEELVKQPLKPVLGGIYYKSNYNGIPIKHIPQKKFKSSLLRILGFVYWHIMALIIGLFQKKVDIILSPSPPLTIGIINVILCKIKGSKSIYNVQEIYPDLMIESGILKSGFLIKFLKRIEKYVYNKSDLVTTIDEMFFRTIVGRFRYPKKLHIVPNFVDTSMYHALTPENLVLDPVMFPPTDYIKVMYAGNIGHAQDWEPLVQLALRLKDEKVVFFVIGEGVLKDSLKKSIEQYNLTNLNLLPYQPRNDIPSILSYSDIQFIFMSPKTENHGFPSKVYTIMACGKPLLICSGQNTPIVNFLSDKNCSFIVSEKELEKKVDIMSDYLKNVNVNDLKKLGNNGMNIIKKHYSKEVVTKQYVKLVSDLINS